MYFSPLIVFPKSALGMERDAKSEKLLFPENSFLSLGRMKCDIGKEASKQSVVSRKLPDFHSFSRRLGAHAELRG